MKRDEEIAKIKNMTAKTLVLELPTSFGKTKAALEYVGNKAQNILVVVPRNVLKTTWKNEIEKWGYDISNYEFTTYRSLHKCTKHYNFVIFDEAHHLSENCLNIVKSMDFDKSVLLSATIGKKIFDIKEVFQGVTTYKVSVRQAIDSNILPDPKVYIIPLVLDNTNNSERIVLNNSRGYEKHIFYKEMPLYLKDKQHKIIVHCTQWQKNQWFEKQIAYYKARRNIVFMRNKWLRLCKDRINWLAEIKTGIVKNILSKYSDYRTITFCASIKQTEEMGEYPIHSNQKDDSNLVTFNNHDIDHITACDMLNEGVNLIDCQVGIFAILNSSIVMQKQKLGRLLRHEEPIIIIPFYLNTREEEIKDEMLKMYNPELVKTISL